MMMKIAVDSMGKDYKSWNKRWNTVIIDQCIEKKGTLVMRYPCGYYNKNYSEYYRTFLWKSLELKKAFSQMIWILLKFNKYSEVEIRRNSSLFVKCILQKINIIHRVQWISMQRIVIQRIFFGLMELMEDIIYGFFYKQMVIVGEVLFIKG